MTTSSISLTFPATLTYTPEPFLAQEQAHADLEQTLNAQIEEHIATARDILSEKALAKMRSALHLLKGALLLELHALKSSSCSSLLFKQKANGCILAIRDAANAASSTQGTFHKEQRRSAEALNGSLQRLKTPLFDPLDLIPAYPQEAPEKTVLREGMATAKVAGKVLSAMGIVLETICTPAGMDNYVRCGFSVIPVTKKGPEKEPSESPLLAAVGNFVQRLIPDGLAKAPQRLQAAHGIDPRITAGFTADILGITLVAATAGSGTPVATLLRRVATRHGIDLRKVTAPVEEIIAMGLLNATREEGSTLATMLKRMATREQARVAQTIPSQIVVYPSSDFYGFFRRNVNKEPFVKGQPFIKTDYNTPKLFTTRDYQVVVATLRNPKGETAELAFSAMRCTDEGLSDTWTVYIDRLLATGAVMGESTRPAGFYRAADHFIKNWLEEKGASRALGQHFIEPSKYSLMGKEEAGVIGKRITQIVERRHLYHGEKPLLHRNILQEHSAAKHNLLSVFNGPQNRLFPTFEIPLRPKSTPKPLFPQQKKPPLVLQREAQQLEISLPPQGVQTKKAVTTTAVYQRSYPRQGDLMWANLGPSVGAELGGERLCVVLSNNLINKQGRTVTLAPLNENPSAHFDIRLFVLDKTRSMQPTQMKTIDQTRLLGEKIGLLNDSARKEVQETLKTLFAMKGCQQVAGMNTYFPLHVSDLGKIFEHPFPKQGTLYWADLGPTLGHELGKRRPVIILPNDMVNQLASTTLVAPFKGKTIPLQRFPKAEDIVPDLCRVIDKSRLDAPIQVLLNPNAMQRIEEALKRVFTIEGTYVVFVQNR